LDASIVVQYSIQVQKRAARYGKNQPNYEGDDGFGPIRIKITKKAKND
jgi:hypothetical protein